MSDDKIKRDALIFVKKNHRALVNDIIADKCKPVAKPASFFMAGSPGAGKTELSIRFIEALKKAGLKGDIVRIDVDEIREKIPGYTGDNSDLFQGAASIVAEKVHDHVLHNNMNFMFDGTFANYEKQKSNLERSLKKQRPVGILYKYLKPEVAWGLTQKREKLDGRYIPKNAFIDLLFNSYNTVARINEEYNEQVSIWLFKGESVGEYMGWELKGKSIGKHLTMPYSKDELTKIL